MTSRLTILIAAAMLAAGIAAKPAAAVGPASPLGDVRTPTAQETGNVAPVRHLNRYGRYCRRQYTLGYRYGRDRARIVYRRHCRSGYRRWHRGHRWDRGYRRHHRHWHRHHRRHHRRRHRGDDD